MTDKNELCPHKALVIYEELIAANIQAKIDALGDSLPASAALNLVLKDLPELRKLVKIKSKEKTMTETDATVKKRVRVLLEVDGAQSPIQFHTLKDGLPSTTDDPQYALHMNNVDDAVRNALYEIGIDNEFLSLVMDELELNIRED